MPASERCPGQPREALTRAKAGFRQELGKECDCPDDVAGFYRTLNSKGQANVTEKSTREISPGNVIQQISPDLDNDGNPEITTITRDFATHTTTTEHPDGGEIVSVDYADGHSKSTTGSSTAPRFYQYTTHAEQGGGRLSATGPSATGPWTKTYENLQGRTLKSTFDDGTTETVLQNNTYDNLGRLVSTKDADNVTQLLEYNAKGEAYRRAIDLNQNGQIDNADRVTDTIQDVAADSPVGPAIRRFSVIYDLANNPVTVSTTYQSTDGLSTRQETLGVANPSTSTRASHLDRADGSWTDTTTHPDGTKSNINYQNWLPVTQSRLDTADNVIESTTLGHDALRRPETQTHSRTGLVTTHYDAANGQVTSTDDHGRVTSFGYDSMGRRIATTLPDTSVSRTSYWPTGQEKASYGSQTNPTVKLYTPAGQLHKLRTFRSTNLALAPDENTGNYDETTWTYNDRGQLDRKEYADTKGTDYTYTPGGRLHTRTWARTIGGAPLVTIYGYNTAGELETTDYSDTTPDVAITFDKLGRQESVTNGVATSAFTYDPATLALDTETISYDLDHNGAADFTRVLDRKPTSLGRDTGWELKDGVTIENEVTYGYHATEGRLSEVSNPQISNLQFSYTYEPNSSLLATITGPAHTVTNVWEPTRNVLDLKQNKVGDTMVSSYDYTMNELGQREDVTTAFDLGGGLSANPGFTDWGYDSLGQIASAAAPGTDTDRAYQYDAIGNRRGQQVGAASFSFNGQGEIVPDAGTTTYSANEVNQYAGTGAIAGALNAAPVFDDDGNMKIGPLSGTGGSTANRLYWDAENRLVEVRAADDTTVVATYAYDALSRRMTKTTGGNTSLFVYDGWNCIAEWSADLQSASLTKTRLWGLDLSGTMQGAGGVGGMLAERHHSGSATNYYPTYDGNGNVSEYLAADGTVAAHFEYDPFGNTVVNTDSSNLFACRFSTKPLDSETGLYYYGYRYYDPLTGRWPSRDPIEEEGGLNLYGFVGNDGIGTIDLLGNQACSLYKKTRRTSNGFEGRTSNDMGLPKTVDGCGAGFTNPLVPDSYLWQAFFWESCNKHDICYQICGRSQGDCDKALGDDMANSCKEKYKTGNPLLYICLAQAATYKNALTAIGGIAYGLSQDKHCHWECCENDGHPRIGPHHRR
jgi:RHS repeat-associated protein